MLFLAILVLALGWAGWLWAWGRDRVAANYGFSMGAVGRGSGGRWGMPRTSTMAHQRRRDLLFALGGLAVASFVGAQTWSALWLLHGIIDCLFLAYAVAVVGVERSSQSTLLASPMVMSTAPQISPLMSAPRMALQPIRDDQY